MRDHSPLEIAKFGGLWARETHESCPPDHATECNNVQFLSGGGVRTRDGLDTFFAQRDVLRHYTYFSELGEGLLVLDIEGKFYHCLPETNVIHHILTVPTATDFAFVGINGRAYISPHNGISGIEDEFLYVYKGDGVTARKAGGPAPVYNASNIFTAANSSTDGNVEEGIHIFGVIYETDTGFLTSIGPLEDEEYRFAQVEVPGDKKVALTKIPIAPGSSKVVARHIVATKAIAEADFTGDLSGYEFFFVPDGRIGNNTATTRTVNFYDAELLQSADHLYDLFESIPAGVCLSTYHNRLILAGEFDNVTVARVSVAGEYEAINQIDGLLIAPLEGPNEASKKGINPLTNFQEFRDVLYGFKKTRTYSWSDSGDVPSTWPLVVIDQGIGASVHGICTVLDSGGVNIEFLIIVDFSGIMVFNGIYLRPELTWKIQDFWTALDRDAFLNIQIVNDPILQRLYLTLPNKQMLMGDYSSGLEYKLISWSPWTFDIETTSISLIETNKLIISSKSVFAGSELINPPDNLRVVV